jgi:energy-converting hydrogenase A subunit R
MEAFIISTSYEPYIDALCDAVKFSKDRTYSTQISLNRYLLEKKEQQKLISLAKEIQEMGMIEWPEGARVLGDLSERDRKKIQRLDQIFWKEIQGMAIGRVLVEVNPVGGKEKANAVLLSLNRTGNRLDEVLYVGDSITDVEAFDLVHRGGGMTLSFNGNRYALRSAEIACLSPHASILAILAEAFRKGGKEGLFEVVERRPPHSLTSSEIDLELVQKVASTSSEGYPKVYRINDGNRANLIQESEAFRKQVRGVAIGSLG